MVETVFILRVPEPKIKREHVGFSFSGGLGGTKQHGDIINSYFLRDRCVYVCVIVDIITEEPVYR